MQKWNLLTSLGFLGAIVLSITVIIVFFFIDPLSFFKKDSSEENKSSCVQIFRRKFAPQQIGEFTKTQTLPARQSEGINAQHILYSNPANQKLLVSFFSDGDTLSQMNPVRSSDKKWEEYVEKVYTYLERQDSAAREKLHMEKTTISGFPSSIAIYSDPELARSQERLPVIISVSLNKNLRVDLSTDKALTDPVLFAEDYIRIICP